MHMEIFVYVRVQRPLLQKQTTSFSQENKTSSHIMTPNLEQSFADAVHQRKCCSLKAHTKVRSLKVVRNVYLNIKFH